LRIARNFHPDNPTEDDNLSFLAELQWYDLEGINLMGLWLSRIEQAPPELSGSMDGNAMAECGQIQGSLSPVLDKVILSQALRPW
jgi:hypothetical protein